ncbi:MAG: hypothetical protein P1U36_10070 [Legionellaceae bacterium]|nr:hypothetical protein [Legionellaceae bacterium]
MNFDDVKARLQALSSYKPVSQVRTLRTDVEESWVHCITESLSARFQEYNNEPECLSYCEALLRGVWPLIQGTSVSYTAMPDSSLTHVLVDLASLIADARNQAWRTEMHEKLDAYQESWLELESNYLNEKSNCITQVQGLLAQKWEFSSKTPELYKKMPMNGIALWVKTLKANVTCVSSPDVAWREEVKEELNNLTHDVITTEKVYQQAYQTLNELLQSNWIAEKARPDSYYISPSKSSLEKYLSTLRESLKKQANHNALGILMPGVYQGDTGHLTALEVLKTHILSGSGQYIYPVSLVSEVRLIDESKKLPYNPNYDDARGNSDQWVNAEEWHRLTTHSPHTEALIQAKANYQKISTEDEHLLSQLTTLIHQLALNDAHGGRGSQEDAAGMAYPALLQFKDYYEALPEEVRSKVPNKIQEEIDLLLDVAFNPKSSVRAQNPIQTCIGSRRKALYAAMQGHDTTLAGISMGKGARQGLIEACIHAFNQARDELKRAFENQTYTGNDNLGITRALLQQLKVTINIESLADINFTVQGMEGQDLAELLAQDNIRSDMIQQLTKLEDLVILVMETSNTKLPIVLHALEARVYALIKTPQDLAALLISLQVDKIEIILRSLNDKLPTMIKNVKDLECVLRPLTPAQCAAVVEVMKDKLSTMIKNVKDLECVLRPLTPAQCAVVFEVMKDKLSTLIKNANEVMKDEQLSVIRCVYDFGDVLRYLTPEQCTAVYEVMKNELLSFIRCVYDFGDVLRYLTPEQCTVVCEAMGDKLLTIIKDYDDLKNVLRYITPEQCTVVCSAMIGKLPSIIQDYDEFNAVIRYYKNDQRTAVYSIMLDKLPNMIKNANELECVLKYLTAEQCAAVIEAMKDKLPAMIKNANDLGCVLRYLTPEQCTVVCEAMKDEQFSFISDGSDFKCVFEHLTPEQCTVVCEAMKDKLPAIIKNANELGCALRLLTPARCAAVVEAMKDELFSFISHGYAFKCVFEHLTPAQRTAVYEVMKNELLSVIRCVYDFECVLRYLTPEQRTVVCSAMIGKLPNMIKNANDLGCVLRYLTPEQCTVVCEAMKDEQFSFISDGSDFKCVFEHLTPEQCTVVYEVMKNELLSVILRCVYDFECVLRYLTLEQRIEFVDFKKIDLINIISSSYDFERALKLITPEQRTVVCSAMIGKLPSIIQDYDEFNAVIRYYKNDQRTAVYSIMLDKLPNMIKNANHLGCVLRYLTPEQRTAVYEVMKDTLPDIINSADDLKHVLLGLDAEQSRPLLVIIQGKLPGMMGKDDELDARIKNFLKGSQQGCFATPRAAKINVGGLEKKLKNYIEAHKEDYGYKFFGNALSDHKKIKLSAAVYALRAHQSSDECLVRLQRLDKVPKERVLKANCKNTYLLVEKEGVATKKLYYIDYDGNLKDVRIKDLNKVSMFFDDNEQLTYKEVSQGLKDAISAELPTDAQLEALKSGLLGDIMAGEKEKTILNGTKCPTALETQCDGPGGYSCPS